MIKRPMLASNECVQIEELHLLNFPIHVTNKLDGVRMLLVAENGRTVGKSRKFIDIPNLFIQEWCEADGIPGLDGEIILPHKKFHDIQSFAMSELTLPRPWEYHVFDWHYSINERTAGYLQRLQMLTTMTNRYPSPRINLVLPQICYTAQEVYDQFQHALDQGHEGLILRSPDGPYKEGRSTRKEGFMLKMKEFEDAEATIIGFEPEYENTNEQTKDNTGQSKRSSHKANLQAKQKLGAFLCKTEAGTVFRIGSGLTDRQKTEFWKDRTLLEGAIVTYKSQKHGEKDKPRCPIFKGIRQD